jgi:hypothetical protein
MSNSETLPGPVGMQPCMSFDRQLTSDCAVLELTSVCAALQFMTSGAICSPMCDERHREIHGDPRNSVLHFATIDFVYSMTFPDLQLGDKYLTTSQTRH